MNTLTDFIDNQLYPALFSRLDRAFPSYKFDSYRGGWASRFKLDGTEPKEPRRDKCVVTSRYPSRIMEQGGESKDLLSLWMEQGHYSNTFEAVVALCNQIGILPPERTNPEEWEKRQREIEKRESLYSKMREALKSSKEGLDLIYDYLSKSRGYSYEYIDKLINWGIGYLTPEIAEEGREFIPHYLDITKHKLVFPYYSGGDLYGFIFRDVTGTATKKYLFSAGLKKALFGLTGLKLTGDREKDRTIIVVEGQLDALHAQLEGLDNVVAAGGVNLSTEALLEAQKRGVESVVVILDTEDNPKSNKARQRNRETALRLIASLGMRGYTCTLPSTEGEKMDVDSFLNSHPIEELEAEIEKAQSTPLFLYDRLEEKYWEKYQNQKQEEVWKETDKQDYINDLITLLSDPLIKPTDREEILRKANQFAGVDENALREEADKIRAVKEQELHAAKTREVLEQASLLAKAGRAEDALEYASKELPKLSQMQRESKFEKMLSRPSFAEFKQRMRNQKVGIKTPYIFRKDREEEVFMLPTGATTLVCAPTSHGKSTMLQNLALQLAKNGEEGVVLYFTFEEEEDAVRMQFLNKFLNLTITKGNNLRTLKDYYSSGDTQYFRREAIDDFKKGESEFEAFMDAGNLEIFRENWDAIELKEAITFFNKHKKIKAVFIDYIQLLKINGFKGDRRLELSDISKMFNELAIDLSLPIILAAQLNRDAGSPLDMHAQNLAESADIERYANTILTLWNSSFKPTTKKSADSKDLKKFEENIMLLGTGGSIYAKIIKNRGGLVGVEGVLNYDGNTGIIAQTPKSSQFPATTASTRIQKVATLKDLIK